MADPSLLPPYPELQKPTVGEAWPTTGQVQYMQQPGGQVQYGHQSYIQPGGQVQYGQQSYIQPGGQVQYGQQSYIQPGGQVYFASQGYNDPSIVHIRDWLPWSIVNIFIGWIFAGILPLIFSLVCRNYKHSNNASGAKTMSTLALIFNILVTLGGIAGWIGLIVAIVIVNKAIKDTTTCLNWPYC